MLDFIVLGIIPGTSFTITFWWAILFSLVLVITIFVYFETTKFKQHPMTKSKSTGSRRQPA
jgi:hypothetical protein